MTRSKTHPEGVKGLEKGTAMKKSEKIAAAKKVAMAVLRNETPDPKLKKLLKEEGCVMTQDKEGFHFVDSDGKGYQFVPKGKLMIQYDRNDWLEYRALAEMLEESSSKRTAKKVEKSLDNVKAKSLRDRLAKTIEDRGVSPTRSKGKKAEPKATPKPKTEKPKASKKSTAKAAPKKSTKKAEPKAKKPKVEVLPKDQQKAEIKKLQKKLKNVKFETIGTWVWATGETREAKDELKRAGFHFSAKKEAWYWKPTEDAPRRRTRFASVDSVRNYWNQPKVA